MNEPKYKSYDDLPLMLSVPEVAEALGIGRAHAYGAWRNLLRAHRNEIAEAFKISHDNFRWYAAFHDEGDHPHCHMMVWSKDPLEAYLSKKGIEKIKSVLTNDIFAHKMVLVYEQKAKMRDDVRVGVISPLNGGNKQPNPADLKQPQRVKR